MKVYFLQDVKGKGKKGEIKEFMELHAEKFDYEIHLKKINRDFSEPIHLDYADNLDSPWQRYF